MHTYMWVCMEARHSLQVQSPVTLHFGFWDGALWSWHPLIGYTSWLTSSRICSYPVPHSGYRHGLPSTWVLGTQFTSYACGRPFTTWVMSPALSIFLRFIYRMFMGVWMNECLCTKCVLGALISWNWNYRQLWATVWVRGSEPQSCEQQPVL